ncbi:MAG: HAMP domain-containing histidine kinase, partial [Lachnospiraceae bacterium]|nr:HAMP domain-containing histidine kinase [Lachnospiraceae bacterium]
MMIKEYVKSRINKWIAILVSAGIVYFSLYLCLEFSDFHGDFLRTTWYPLFLATVCWGVITAIDFAFFAKKYMKLKNARNNIDETLSELPGEINGLEKQYTELLQLLYDKKNKDILKQKNTYTDMSGFITVWTHQIKTPLTALQLQTADLSEPQRTQILSRLFEIEQYVDMVLQYFRIENNSTDYVFKKYNVKNMVNRAVKYFARTFISKGLSVKVDIDDNAYVITDEKWLVFTMKQIISNSLKYTESGSVTIDMPSDNQIRIRDTGIGIAAEDLPRIFE